MKRMIMSMAVLGAVAANVVAGVPRQKSSMVADRVAEFVPARYDRDFSPSLILVDEPDSVGALPAGWLLKPEFSNEEGCNVARVRIPAGTSLYGGGEVTGPLLRNGQKIKFWNTDAPFYNVDGGRRLYQTHPWVMGVRADGTSFGILFDTFAKGSLETADAEVVCRSEGAPFRVYILERDTPQEMVKALAALTGTISMPPLWALGYHQCRFSYFPESRVQEIAMEFRKRDIPCDVIWFDIDYMDGFRVFTFDDSRFPDPARMNRFLHDRGFKSVYMIDPGVAVDTAYKVYSDGHRLDYFVKDAYRNEYHGRVWPESCAFPDFTRPEVREWWSGLYKDFLATGIDGVWNDMNEPSVFSGPGGTMPESNIHLGGGNLPTGNHRLYHNAYGRLMVEGTYNGMLRANPGKRPFVLSRANLLGGQRFAAVWTGDNGATTDQMKLSVPMSLTLSLSGQPFSGPDIGGFLENTSPELFGEWMGFGAFLPFARGHACAGTNQKEPWAFGKAVERESRMALQRRYRLLPYYYTLFEKAHREGTPVMAPVFFADPADARLRDEQQAFLIGDNLLVIPSFARDAKLPEGIWEPLSLVSGDTKGRYQARLKVKGGSIIPVGKAAGSTTENLLDPLTLIVVTDADGNAAGEMYWDSGDGWDYKDGQFARVRFSATTQPTGKVVVEGVVTEGSYPVDLSKVSVRLLRGGKERKASGDLTKGIKL